MDLVHDDRAVQACVLRNLVHGSFQGLQNDVSAGLLVAFQAVRDLFDLTGSVYISAAAAKDNAFLDCCSCRVQGVFHTVFGFLHLCLGSGTDTDDSYAAGQLGQTLLQLLLIKAGCGLFDLVLDLGGSCRDGALVARAVYDDGGILCDLDGFRAAKLVQGRVLELQAQVSADNGTAGQDGDILQHGFPSVTIAGCLDSRHIECAAQLVDDQSGQGFAFDILSDDQQSCAHLDDLLQQGQDVLNGGDLLVRDQDERIFQIGFHLVHISCHVGGDIASVELHAFNQVQLGQHGLALFDGDDAVLGDLLHSVRYHLADLCVAGRDRCHILNVRFAVDGCAHLFDSLDSSVCSLLHAFSEDNGVRACRQVLHTLIDHCLRENCSCCSSVTCYIISLCGNFLDELCAHVLEIVLEFDLLCDRNTVVGNRGSAIALVENDISSLGAECDLYCICKFVDAGSHCYSGICSVFEIFCHINYLFLIICRSLRCVSLFRIHLRAGDPDHSMIARISLCLTIIYFSSSSLTSVPAYLE